MYLYSYLLASFAGQTMNDTDTWTSVPIRTSVRDRLQQVKGDGESYTDLIERALDYAKEHEVKPEDKQEKTR